MSNLRNKIIRLAHSKPELRKHLLPLITASAYDKNGLRFEEIVENINSSKDKVFGNPRGYWYQLNDRLSDLYASRESDLDLGVDTYGAEDKIKAEMDLVGRKIQAFTEMQKIFKKMLWQDTENHFISWENPKMASAQIWNWFNENGTLLRKVNYALGLNELEKLRNEKSIYEYFFK